MLKNKKQLLTASALTLLPAVLILAMHRWLTEQMTALWGFDGSLPLLGAMVFMPLSMLVLLWLCAWITSKDPGNQGRNQKVSAVMLWILPIISNLVCAMFIAISLGAANAIPRLFPIFLGLLFAVIGNFMPKTRRNSTIGIKVSWTLASEENWNATHRFTGRLWFICGIALMSLACLPAKIGLPICIILIFCLALAPMVYAYCYYRKQRKAGTAPDVNAVQDIRFTKWTLALLAVILIFVGVLMFTGNIAFTFEEESFTMEASYYTDLTVRYEDIDSIEYREYDDRGTRACGFGSGKLLMGAFQNEEFGIYTRYSYVGCKNAVVVRSGEKVLVISGPTENTTKGIYAELTERVG